LSDRRQARVFTPATVPIYYSFFAWGFGTGAQQLARPLFAYALTGNEFLVALMISMNAIPRIVTGPLTGYLADRIGRKPLAILGPGLRGLSNLGQFFATDFPTFFALEFMGQVGVSMWGTTSNVLVADITTTSDRGRVQALRQMSMRMGLVAGPALGGVLAVAFGFPSLFLLNAVTKMFIVVIVWLKVEETRPAPMDMEKARPAVYQPTPAVNPYTTSSFVAVAVAVAFTSLASAAVLLTLLPVYAKEVVGVSESAVGLLISIAAALSFFVAYPNGMLADRFGRKASIVPALLFLSLASFGLSAGGAYGLVVIAVAVHGIGEGMAMGSNQAYAMDQAPEAGRGRFLGVVQMVQALGAFVGPLAVGAIYQGISPAVAFTMLGASLAIAAAVVGVSGRETVGRRARSRAPAE
jgi:MFS family permease